MRGTAVRIAVGSSLLVACASPAAPPSAVATGTDAGFAPSPTTFTLRATVPPSSEAFKCTYVTMPETAGFIVGGEHEYTPGGHHVVVYRTDLTTIPPGAETPSAGDCYTATADYVSHIAGLVYEGLTPTGNLKMPAGVGLPFRPNEILLVEVHYLNATAKPLSAQVDVHFDTQTAPVEKKAGAFFFHDRSIYIPQGANGVRASTRCPIPTNITIFAEASHYQALGVRYHVYLDPPSGTETTTPFYTSADWTSPFMQLQSMEVAAGSYVRFYCDYDNTQGTQAVFEGPNAATNEVCMFLGLYYPAMDPSDEQCSGGDELGTGTADCNDTLTCLATCPSNGLPPLDAGAGFSDCAQRCFVTSCPSASAPVEGLLDCMSASCPDCGGSDASGSYCGSCASSKCASQSSACSSHTCTSSADTAPDGGW